MGRRRVYELRLTDETRQELVNLLEFAGSMPLRKGEKALARGVLRKVQASKVLEDVPWNWDQLFLFPKEGKFVKDLLDSYEISGLEVMEQK